MNSKPPEIRGPDIASIRQAREFLGDSILTTPVWQCRSSKLTDLLGAHFSLWLKLELWQYAGSFKIRAALLSLAALNDEQKQKGVIAVSAGNHAIAVARAARQYKVHAKVLMPKTASPVRISQCQTLGAEVLLMEDMEEIFSKMESIQKAEQRTIIHPFDGEMVTLGTGTLGLEIHEQVGEIDYILAGVGGGGLVSGVANACKQLQEHIKIIGVEPTHSAVMQSSLTADKPQSCVPKSIADSLGAPITTWRPLILCRRFVDKIVTVNDESIAEAMRFLFQEMKLAVEPAAAVSIAALMGPLHQELRNKKVCIILSGSNIDANKFCRLLQGGVL